MIFHQSGLLIYKEFVKLFIVKEDDGINDYH